MSQASSFAEALHADGPAPDHAEKLNLYGRFVGAWSFDAKPSLKTARC